MILGISLVISLVYLVSAFVVFDFSTFAPDGAREYSSAHVLLSFGPRPRAWACTPLGTHDYYFTGKEWVFVLYKPVCVIFNMVEGYENLRPE